MKRSLNDNEGQKIETMLRPLILQHGLSTVQAHLEKLYGKARHSDYMRVVAIAKNVSNRIERQKGTEQQ